MPLPERLRRLIALLAIVLVAGACGDSGDSTEAGESTDAVAADWSELDGGDVEALALLASAPHGSAWGGAVGVARIRPEAVRAAC